MTERATYIGPEKDPYDNALELVTNWYHSCKHLPETEMLEKMALMVATIFRDKTLAHETKGVFITCVSKTETECRMYGDKEILLTSMVNCLGQAPFRDLVLKALVARSLINMVER